MKIEEIDIIQENLKKIKLKSDNLNKLDKFLESLKEHKQLDIYSIGNLLMFKDKNIFDFAGVEIIELLESKKTKLEKEIHNFTLDQLLPKDETILQENSDLGIKFLHIDDLKDDDTKCMYYQEDENGVSSTISWFEKDSKGSFCIRTNKAFTIKNCQDNFNSGIWIKV